MGNIGRLLDRPRAYYNIDGVGELGGGIMSLGYAVILWILVYTPQRSLWHKTVLLDFAAMLAIIHYGSKAIKTHITYPRTGYVEYRRRARLWQIVLGAIIGAAATAAFVAVIRLHWDLTTPARLIGLPVAAAYAYAFPRTARWKWAVVALMVAGSLTIALRTTDWAEALLLTLVVYGAIFLASGAISFWLYLHRTQPPARETQ